MNEQLEIDQKMIADFEQAEYEQEKFNMNWSTLSTDQIKWVLDLYTRYEDEIYKNDQLTESLQEQGDYIEDWQIGRR